jgi:hypothetical protein
MKRTPKAVTCSRGHRFMRSGDCPVCPKCWPGRYAQLAKGEFDTLGAPAQRALLNAKIMTLAQAARHAPSELVKLHGMGPNAMTRLKLALRARGLSFAAEKKTAGKKPYVHRHADGSVWAKGFLMGGKMAGFWKWFRKDGTVMRSGSFTDGKQTGEWTTYDKKGRAVKVTKFK